MEIRNAGDVECAMKPYRLTVDGEWRVHWLGTVDSTQDRLRRAVERGVRGRHAVVATEQRRGRGRHGRRWLSPPGGLYVSLLLAPDPLLFARLGLSVAEVIEGLGVDAELLWPNDVAIRGRKLAGLLIEVTRGCAVAGIGINVQRTPLTAAACLMEGTGDPVDLHDLLRRLLHRVDVCPDAGALDGYRERCATLGQTIRLESCGEQGGGCIEGMAVDIDEDGRLVVEGRHGRRAVSVGDVHRLSRDGLPLPGGRLIGRPNEATLALCAGDEEGE
jgi:BirA family biotin operon repressor/biotin-[acetyl-CoA-carboxylase] ligase